MGCPSRPSVTVVPVTSSAVTQFFDFGSCPGLGRSTCRERTLSIIIAEKGGHWVGGKEAALVNLTSRNPVSLVDISLGFVQNSRLVPALIEISERSYVVWTNKRKQVDSNRHLASLVLTTKILRLIPRIRYLGELCRSRFY
jgi:hypothetical protein